MLNKLFDRFIILFIYQNKLLNWTFDGLPFGSKYEIKVQVLPSDDKNYVAKEIVLPRKKGIKCSLRLYLFKNYRNISLLVKPISSGSA